MDVNLTHKSLVTTSLSLSIPFLYLDVLYTFSCVSLCVCAHFHFINWILLFLYFLEYSLFINCTAKIFKFSSMWFSWHTFIIAIFKIETKIYWSKDFCMFPWYRCLPIYSTFLASWIKNFCSASELPIWWATATYVNGNSLIFLQLVLKGLKRCEWDA